MMNALLDMDADSTVIVIDWGKGSNPPYNQACANIRLVGNIVGHFIYTMMVSSQNKVLPLFLQVLILHRL